MNKLRLMMFGDQTERDLEAARRFDQRTAEALSRSLTKLEGRQQVRAKKQEYTLRLKQARAEARVLRWRQYQVYWSELARPGGVLINTLVAALVALLIGTLGVLLLWGLAQFLAAFASDIVGYPSKPPYYIEFTTINNQGRPPAFSVMQDGDNPIFTSYKYEEAADRFVKLLAAKYPAGNYSLEEASNSTICWHVRMDLAFSRDQTVSDCYFMYEQAEGRLAELMATQAQAGDSGPKNLLQALQQWIRS